MSDDIDWRRILKAYMAGVMTNEGVAFEREAEGLTDEEMRALYEVFTELLNETPSYGSERGPPR